MNIYIYIHVYIYACRHIYIYIHVHFLRFTWGDYETPHVNTPYSLIYMGRLRIPPCKSKEDIEI